MSQLGQSSHWTQWTHAYWSWNWWPEETWGVGRYMKIKWYICAQIPNVFWQVQSKSCSLVPFSLRVVNAVWEFKLWIKRLINVVLMWWLSNSTFWHEWDKFKIIEVIRRQTTSRPNIEKDGWSQNIMLETWYWIVHFS